MRYMLLIHEPVGQRQARTPAEGEAAYARMLGFAEELKSRGQHLASESLKSQHEAVRVERRGDQKRVTDGPFAEAREMVGGFFMIDCADRDEAVALAARCPAAEWATVEVRELGPCFS